MFGSDREDSYCNGPPPSDRRATADRAVAFAAAATVLSSTFAGPDSLREPGSVVLSAFAAGGTGPGLVHRPEASGIHS